MSHKIRKRNGKSDNDNVSNSVESVDFALLTSALVPESVFKDCVDAIVREIALLEELGISCNFYANLNCIHDENKADFKRILTKANANITSSSGTGFSEGANKAIRMGRSPLVLFITDDVILHEGSVLKLIQRMEDKIIGLCGMKLLFPKNSNHPNMSGRVQHIGHAFSAKLECVHPLIGWSSDNPKCGKTRELQSVTGAVFMVRRGLFDKVGGFFTGYGLGYYEDVDLCFSIRSTGAKVWIDAEAVAIHHTNASMVKSKKKIPMRENRELFISRWGKFILPDEWSFL